MFKAIATDRKEVKIAGMAESGVKKAFKALIQDHPEFSWIDSQYSFTEQFSGLVNKVSFSWKTDTAKRNADKQTIESQANAFIQSLGADSSTYDCVKAAIAT